MPVTTLLPIRVVHKNEISIALWFWVAFEKIGHPYECSRLTIGLLQVLDYNGFLRFIENACHISCSRFSDRIILRT